MEMPKDYEETVGITGEYERVEAGGYICKIVNAKTEKSQAGNEMLVLAIDIAEGEHQGYFKRRYDELVKQCTDPSKMPKYPNNAVHRIMVLDKEGKCNRFFKGFGTIIEESNQNYKWTGDEKSLKDKKIGVVFGEEEYQGNNGQIKTSTKIRSIRSVQAIEDGKFEIPEKKKLAAQNNIFDTTVSDDDDLPF